MFGAAVDNGLIKINPAKGALQFKKDKQAVRRIITEQEEDVFFDYIRNNGYHRHYVPLFTVGFGTGMRIGEIFALTWEDIDFENNVIHVNKTLARLSDYINNNGRQMFVINKPKTETSIRDVPILPKVKEALLEQRETQTKSKITIDGYTDFVFTTRNGNVYSNANINLALKAIADGINRKEKQKAEAENRDPTYFEKFTPHCMRHTFATRCYEKGVKPKVVQKILGHKTLDMTLDVYTHVTDEMLLSDMKKLEE